MSPKKVLILGGIGNGSVIAAAMADANLHGWNEYIAAGEVNDRVEPGGEIAGLPVLGGLDKVGELLEQRYYFFNTIYKIDGQKRRIGLFENLRIPQERLAVFRHPLSYIAPDAKLSPGCVVMPGVCISPGATLGKCCLLMPNATIGHNTIIGDYGHFAAQSCLGSFVRIGKGVHIGLNATVRENVTLGDYSALGMGAVLLDNMGQQEIWAGNPAKFIRKALDE